MPASAESSSARDAVNKETSNAPSLSDIGKNLTQNLFGGGKLTHCSHSNFACHRHMHSLCSAHLIKCLATVTVMSCFTCTAISWMP